MNIISFSIEFDTKKILITLNGSIIGWIKFKVLEQLRFYLLYNFYIKPEFRDLGYGKALFKCTINYLADKNAEKVFLIPDPFELDNKELAQDKYDANLEKLINFYSKLEFEFLNNANEAEKLLTDFEFSGKSYRLMHLIVKK